MDYRKALVILPFCLISYSAVAGKWTITPSLNLTESFTDNLLTSQHSPQSSWITELTPGLTIFGHGRNLDARLIYQSANVNYQTQSVLNDSYDYYSGDLDFRLLNNKWRINLSASKGYQVNSLSDGINPIENLVTPNQTSISNYIVSTSFASKVSNFFVYSIDLRANKVHGQGQFNNNHTRAGYFSISNSNLSQLNRNYWQISVDGNEITENENNNANNQNFLTYSAETGVKFSEDYWFFFQYFGQKNDLRISTAESLDSSHYGGGLRWYPSDKIDIKLAYNKSLDDRNSDFTSLELTLKPSRRTRLYLDTGKRFYGDYYELLFNYRLKRFSSTISYNEQITSYSLGLLDPSLQGDLICPVSSQFNINDCSLSTSVAPVLGAGQQLISADDFFPDNNQQTYLEKRLNANFSYTKRKIRLFLRFSRSERKDLAGQNERQENYTTLIAGYRINNRANINLSLSYRDSKLNPGESTRSSAKDQILSLGYDHKITRSASARIILSHNNRDATGSLDSYDENRIVLSLNKDF